MDKLIVDQKCKNDVQSLIDHMVFIWGEEKRKGMFILHSTIDALNKELKFINADIHVTNVTMHYFDDKLGDVRVRSNIGYFESIYYNPVTRKIREALII